MTGAAGPLRILHVISSDRFAGVEQFVRRLAIRQAHDGHMVSVLGGPRESMAGPLSSAGVEWGSSATARVVFIETRRRIPAFDIVNTHMTAADVAVWAARASSNSSAPIVSTRHFAQRRGSTGPAVAYRLIESRIDAEISISHAVAARIGVESTVVYPGVEPSPIGDSARRRPVVLVAQRLQPEKHTDIAVRAFAASGVADHGWTLEIAGTGPDMKGLQALARSLAVGEAVRFLGFRTDLPLIMAESGILFASSPYEHFGLTVLEAMAAGLPIVAADAGGHAEMLRGLDVRALYPPGDEASAAERIRALAADAEARAALGASEHARQSAEFTLEAQARATEAVYRRAISARGGKA